MNPGASLLTLMLRSAGPIRACGTAGGHRLKVGVNDDVHYSANPSRNKFEFLGSQFALIGRLVLFRHDEPPPARTSTLLEGLYLMASKVKWKTIVTYLSGPRVRLISRPPKLGALFLRLTLLDDATRSRPDGAADS